jgi:hypothetical protein
MTAVTTTHAMVASNNRSYFSGTPASKRRRKLR